MITLLIFLFTVFADRSWAAQAPKDLLEQSIGVIGESMDTIDSGLNKIHSKATTCSKNYDQARTCPKAIPKGIRDAFVSPLRELNEENKKLWEAKLKPLPAQLKKPVDIKELEKVDACSGNEEVLVTDYEEKLGKLKEASAALDHIYTGGKDEGMLDVYQKLHPQTAKQKEGYQRMANACKDEAAKAQAGVFAGLAAFVDIPASPHHGFLVAFSRNNKFPNCASSVLQGYTSVGDPDTGALATINKTISKLKPLFSTRQKNLEEAIRLSKIRLENCKSNKANPDAKGEPDRSIKNPPENAEEKKEVKKEVEKEFPKAQQTEDPLCNESVTNPYGNTYQPNSCYRASGTAKERANNLAKLRKEDPAALEKALVDRNSPESKALSKKLLDEADAYAKSQKPPLPSPKVSGTDTVCGESCVAYLKAKSAESSGMDSITVNYLKKKASQTQRRKLGNVPL